MATTGKDITESVLKRLVERGVFTIPELVEDTGTSMTTLAKYVSQLQEMGLVEPRGKVKGGGRGREPVLYGVTPGDHYFLGVDVRSDELRIALMDYSGTMVKSSCISSFRYENTSDNLEMVCSEIERFLATEACVDKSSVAMAGVLLGGRVDSVNGTSASTYILEQLDETPLAEYFEERLGIRTHLENDTKAMAYGEYLAIIDKGYRNVLFVNIGWGLGLGIIINGELYQGRNGYSGEFGHVHAYANNILCHCGKKGCMETEVSGRAVHRQLIERLARGESSILASKYRRGEKITMSDIIDASQKEDPLCVDLIGHVASELGEQISALLNIFNPECVIVGGSLSRAASYYFYYPMRAALRKYSLKLLLQDVDVRPSALGEEAGVRSGCLLAREIYLNEIIQNYF